MSSELTFDEGERFGVPWLSIFYKKLRADRGSAIGSRERRRSCRATFSSSHISLSSTVVVLAAKFRTAPYLRFFTAYPDRGWLTYRLSEHSGRERQACPSAECL